MTLYHEVNEMPRCANCGILIPCSAQFFDHHGVALYACSEKCMRVYDSYKFPRYRDDILEAERRGAAGPRLGYVGKEVAPRVRVTPSSAL